MRDRVTSLSAVHSSAVKADKGCLTVGDITCSTEGRGTVQMSTVNPAKRLLLAVKVERLNSRPRRETDSVLASTKMAPSVAVSSPIHQDTNREQGRETSRLLLSSVHKRGDG